MQGQIEGVNGFVVNIFRHYILSDKADLELEREGGLPANLAALPDLLWELACRRWRP
jgi:hypothetical protein